MAAAAFNNLESPLSMIEKTAKRILPVINNVQKCLIKEKRFLRKKPSLSEEAKEGSGMASVPDEDEEDMESINQEEDNEAKKIENQYEADMRSVLGYLNQSEWISNINIGNIMQIQPYKMNEVLDIQRNET